MKMPFGPYEDIEVKDIPVSYCQKLLGRMEVKDKQLKKELEDRVEGNNGFPEEHEDIY